MLLFVSFDVIWCSEDPKFAVLADDAQALRRQAQAIESGHRLWESWVLQTLGTIIGFDGAAGRLEIPSDRMGDLDNVVRQYSQVLGDVDVCVGIGQKLQESDQALKLAVKKFGGIVFYTPDVDRALKEIREKEEKDGSAEDLHKADPKAQVAENSPAAGGGFSGATEPGTPASPQAGSGEASEHSQGEAMASEASDAPGAAEGTHAASDFQDQFKSAADDSQKQDEAQAQGTDQGQQVADLKTAVVKVLQGIKAQAPLLQQLQAVEPDLFAAIQGMTKALLMMAKTLLGGDQQVQKSEALVHPLIKAERLFGQAAFRSKDGRVEPTGSLHDVGNLPPDFDLDGHEEGFLGMDGNFYSHKEAAALAAQPPTEAGPVKKSEFDDNGEPRPIPVKHYSVAKDLQVVNPRFQGKGSAGPERQRPKRIPRSYFYERNQKPEAHVAANSYLYHGELPKGTRLYDMSADPLNLLESGLVQTPHGQIHKTPDLDQVEKKLKKLGYHGYHNYGPPGALAYFHDLPVISGDGKERDVTKSEKCWNGGQWAGSSEAARVHHCSCGAHLSVTPKHNPKIAGETLTGWHVRVPAHNEGGDSKKAEESMAKGKLPLPESQSTHKQIKYPVGQVKDSSPGGSRDVGKIKIQDPESGKTKWRQVRAGLVMAPDGTPTSSRNPSGGK